MEIINATSIVNETTTVIVSPTSAVFGFLNGIVSSINDFFVKIYPQNPNIVVLILAFAIGYAIKSKTEEGFWFWVFISLVFYGAMRYVGLGV
ncbi:MAG: hypothetical protein QXU20_05055 [Candidatus Woesearchaeota archaeon]